MKNIIFSAKFTLTPPGVTLVNLRVEYLFTYRVASTHDLNAILFPPSSENTVGCIAV